jgi:hypothetical protein
VDAHALHGEVFCVVHHLSREYQAGASADRSGYMNRFHHLLFVGALFEAAAGVGVYAVGALHRMGDGEGDEGFFAFRQCALLEHFAVPGEEFIGHGFLPIGDISEFFKVFGIEVLFFRHAAIFFDVRAKALR